MGGSEECYSVAAAYHIALLQCRRLLRSCQGHTLKSLQCRTQLSSCCDTEDDNKNTTKHLSRLSTFEPSFRFSEQRCDISGNDMDAYASCIRWCSMWSMLVIYII